jgi:TolB protein
MDLTSGLVTPLTDTPGYDSAPAWSPDGLWIVYETYLDENLEIMISSAVGTGETIRLTNHPAADHSPAWSPQGRQIAFISQRDGTNQIWLADLDQPESMRYQIVNHDIGNYSAHPAWSPAGESLAWVGEQDGLRQVFLWTPAQPEMSPRIIGSGDWPTWSPDGQRLLTLLRAPNHSYLTAYPVFTTGLALPPLLLPGEVDGIEWVDLPNSIPLRDPFRQAALLTLTPAWQPNLTVQPDQSGGRYSLVPLQDVEAPFAQLHDAVDEAFQALRDRVAYEVGWDYLATLENAYTPLTTSLEPGMQQDWLYTGRSFTLNTLPINAGWVVVVREDFGQQTYWRLFLRARFQDGSAGAPLRELPWDFNARYDGDPTVYDAGGRFVDQIPPGYWIDLTRLAGSYGWERLPALFTWRSAYSAARFNQFVRSEGLDWATAMLQLYPAEILITPSPIIPPTRTFTPTPRFYQTPTPTVTPTLRPTFTPLPPTATVTPNFTPTKVQPTTPLPTRTSTPSKIPSLTPTPKE